MDQLSDHARFERYRLMVISTWPESAAKRAALASARAGLDREVAITTLPPDEPIVRSIPRAEVDPFAAHIIS